MKIEVELHSDFADRIVIASLKQSISYLTHDHDDYMRRCVLQTLSFYLNSTEFEEFERSLLDEDIEEALRVQAKEIEWAMDDNAPPDAPTDFPKEETLEWKAAEEIKRLRLMVDELVNHRWEEKIVNESRFDG